MSTTETHQTQYGRQFPGQPIVWEPFGDWASVLETEAGRQAEKDEYAARFRALGIEPSPEQTLRIYSREVTIEYGEPVETDLPPVPEPEPVEVPYTGVTYGEPVPDAVEPVASVEP